MTRTVTRPALRPSRAPLRHESPDLHRLQRYYEPVVVVIAIVDDYIVVVVVRSAEFLTVF